MASVTVIFGGKEEQSYTLDKPAYTVGREPSCEIAIDNLGISRQHCKVVNKGGAFVVQDLGSANGTFVNGKKIVEHFLNDGDEIFIGKYILKFSNESQSQAASSAQRSDNVVPDTLNTFVMDGAKIQEQLAKMRSQGGATPSPDAAPPVTAKDYAKAMDVPAPSAGGNKSLLLVGGAIIVLLFLLVIILGIFLLTRG